MPANPRLRASDADRDRIAALLREHYAAGRLDADEFSERLAAAYAARTMGELDELMTDLPAIDLYLLPDRSVTPSAGPSVEVDHQPVDHVMARTAAILTAVALTAVSGVVYGIWWIPWWFIILIVAFRMARRQHD
jgi:Domain of unknown function (DUF1707)